MPLCVANYWQRKLWGTHRCSGYWPCATPFPLSPLTIRCVAGRGVVCQAVGVRRADGCEAARERGGDLWVAGASPCLVANDPPPQVNAATSSSASTQTHGDTRATPNDLGMSCVHHGKPTTWWLAGCTRGRHMSGEVVAPFFECTSALPPLATKVVGDSPLATRRV
jgi:hypothetical protein